MIVPYGPGGGGDIAARLFSEALATELGVTITVENREGGGGIRGTTDIVNAEPDGYTMGITPIPLVITHYADPERNAPYSLEDLIPFVNHDSAPSAILVRPESPFQTLEDLVAAAKADQGGLTAASSAFLGAGHLGLLSLGAAANVEFATVEFPDSGQERAALLGGHVDFGIGTANELVPVVNNGELRMLTVFDSKRFPGLPSVPTAQELGYDVLMGTNRVFAVPAGTPDDIVARLASASKVVIESEAYRAKAEEVGFALNYLGPEETLELWDALDRQISPLIRDFRAGP